MILKNAFRAAIHRSAKSLFALVVCRQTPGKLALLLNGQPADAPIRRLGGRLMQAAKPGWACAPANVRAPALAAGLVRVLVQSQQRFARKAGIVHEGRGLLRRQNKKSTGTERTDINKR
jgi:hypothetical protein